MATNPRNGEVEEIRNELDRRRAMWNWAALVTAAVGLASLAGAAAKSYVEPIQLQQTDDKRAIDGILKRLDAEVKESQDKDWALQRERGELTEQIKELHRRVGELEHAK